MILLFSLWFLLFPTKMCWFRLVVCWFQKSTLANNGAFAGPGPEHAGDTRVFGHDPRNLRVKKTRGCRRVLRVLRLLRVLRVLRFHVAPLNSEYRNQKPQAAIQKPYSEFRIQKPYSEFQNSEFRSLIQNSRIQKPWLPGYYLLDLAPCYGFSLHLISHARPLWGVGGFWPKHCVHADGLETVWHGFVTGRSRFGPL